MLLLLVRCPGCLLRNSFCHCTPLLNLLSVFKLLLLPQQQLPMRFLPPAYGVSSSVQQQQVRASPAGASGALCML
jgi:DTW domain-containing protein YfiP